MPVLQANLITHNCTFRLKVCKVKHALQGPVVFTKECASNHAMT